MPFKVGMISLGCPKNLIDSEIMLGILKEKGFVITNLEKEADVIIINTCSFIEDAKKESIENILSAARLKGSGNCRALLVSGCLAQRYHRELLTEVPEIDGLIGTGKIPDIAAAVEKTLQGEKVCVTGPPGYLHGPNNNRILATPGYTAYLKIAEGCDNHCSYCIIPEIRGNYKSRSIEDVTVEAARLVRQGAKELILVAQDITRYGADIYGKPVLEKLLKKLLAIEGMIWIRLLYAYPSLIGDELIELLARERRICRYLDMPVQHASDRLLRKMNRRGNKMETVKLVEKLRSAVPGITLRTSLIVGFPGESEDDFEELLEFMNEVKFDRVGVFAYSQEEGTPAAAMSDQVPDEVKLERRGRAMALQQEISLEKNREKIGRIMTVLTERRSSGMRRSYAGRSEGDAPGIDGNVFFKSDLELKPGDFVRVRIKKAQTYDLFGELLK
ncbi:MAG TPA: 30S ribosomal protein S12 methylthiotransferase RimO [Bacillota bacterium]|nr:30S ribosomal protein S12 methylthiotransferase RimO [Bacillota bacterium]